MNRSEHEVAANTRRQLVIQLICGVLVAAAFAYNHGATSAWGAIYGAGISISSLLLLARGVTNAQAMAITDPKRSMGVLYFGAVQRFVMVIVLFIVGVKLLTLDPLAMAAGFIAGQFANVFNLRRPKTN